MRSGRRARVLAVLAATSAVAGTVSAAGAAAQPLRAAVATPVVRSVSPASAGTAGGSTIALTGSNFLHTSKIFFGTVPATRFAVHSATSLAVRVPPHSAGSVWVRVQTRVNGATATSAAGGAARFGYVAPPTVSAVTPSSGPSTGGNAVTVRGSGLRGTTRVLFGTTAARVSTVTATALIVRAPARAAGAVHVRVTTAYGTSAAVPADRYTYLGGPSPVTGLTASSTIGRVTLHWTNPAGATGVVVRRATGSTAPETVTDGVGVAVTGTATSAVDNSVADFQNYSYSVFAASGSGYSAPAETDRGAPGPVTDPGSDPAEGRITFHWTNPAGLDHLIVALGKYGGVYLPPPGQGPSGIDLGTADSYVATGLDSRTEYTLTVYTLDAEGNSAGDVAITDITLDGDDQPPGPVTAVSASPSATGVQLSWTNPPDGDLAGVAVARGDGATVPSSPDSPWIVGESAQGATTLTDPDVEPGHTYTYALWAEDSSGNYATPVTVTTTTPPGAPTAPVAGLSATALPPSVVASGQSIDLQWTNPTGVASLVIARAQGADAPQTTAVDDRWTVAAPTHEFLDPGLPDGTRFSYSVWAVAADGTYSQLASATATSDANLPRAVSGQVVDSIAGQTVPSVTLWFADGGRSYSTTSDADGGYHLDLPVGTYSVCTDAVTRGSGAAQGYLSGCMTGVVGDASSTRLDVSVTPEVVIAGIVTDASTQLPVAGVQVFIPSGALIPPYETTTDADGRYVLAGLPASAYAGSVTVASSPATGGARFGYTPITFSYPPTTAGQTVHHDVALQPLPVLTVHGRLTSAVDGTAIGGVGVVLLGANPAVVPDPAIRTSADGSFTASVGVHAGQQIFACVDAEGSLGDAGDRPTGYTNACYGGADFAPGNPSYPNYTIRGTATAVNDGQDVSMTLQPVSTVTGTVTGSTGTPLAGITVSARITARPVLTTRTDAEGHYVLHTAIRTGSDPANGFVVCSGQAPADDTAPAGYLSSCSQQVTPTVNQPDVTADVSPALAAGIGGTVTDASSGAPAPGVEVLLEDVALHYVVFTAFTASDGTWSVAGIDAAGDPQLTVCFTFAHASAAVRAGYADQCAGGATPTIVTLVAGTIQRLDAGLVRSGSISGVIRAADTGDPLPGVTVGVGPQLTATTDSSGHFSITGVAPGSNYRLTASGSQLGTYGYLGAELQHAPAINDPVYGWVMPVTPGADTQVDLALPVAAALRVKVVTQGGLPIAGASVSAQTASDVTTAADGYATLTGLRASDPRVLDYLCAGGGTGAGTSVGYQTACVVTPTLRNGDVASATIVRFPLYGAIATTVHDAATGQPVPGANVSYSLVDESGEVTSQTFGTAGTNGVAYPVLAIPIGPGPVPPPQTQLRLRLCVTADGYQQACAYGDSVDGASGPVISTQLGIDTDVQVALTRS